METKTYIVRELKGFVWSELGEFRELNDAILFMEAYMNKYYAQPGLNLSIERSSPEIEDSDREEDSDE